MEILHSRKSWAIKEHVPNYNLDFEPMPHMGYYEESVEEVLFLSENLVIVNEIGDFFLYWRPSKKQVPRYKADSDVSSNGRELIYSPKRRRPTKDDPIVGIIGTTPSIKRKIPPTTVLTQGNDVSNFIPSLSHLQYDLFLFVLHQKII